MNLPCLGRRAMSLNSEGVMDATARILVTSAFFLWNLYEGSVFEAPYDMTLVKLYGFPLFRFMLVLLVLAGSYWCPHVGSMVALAVFFYIEDMEKLKRPWITYEKKE
jgi:hypothetical protein